ncbi:hypothetical protein V1264_005898 [Littorina saxatilis]|uniref:C2H2-type domain-containing protein n=1 Tax=Littorina saxatilis TaxID=31220 RepID=A0AAN9B0F5_9CAEN
MELSAVTLDSFLDVSTEETVQTQPLQDLSEAIGLPAMTSTPAKKTRVRELCQDCGKIFSRMSSLKEHRRMKHDFAQGPRYSCQHCAKTFMNRSDFHSHISAHSGVKPHLCEKCNKSFQNRRNLTRYIDLLIAFILTWHYRKLFSNKGLFSCLVV